MLGALDAQGICGQVLEVASTVRNSENGADRQVYLDVCGSYVRYLEGRVTIKVLGCLSNEGCLQRDFVLADGVTQG